MSNTIESQVFSACKGVFQGGGCKAVAYIGAYREALEQGVIFSEVSGSSAGSLVASLIAAGATPDQMEQIIENFDIKAIRNQGFIFRTLYFFLNRIPKKIESIISFPRRKSEVKWKTWHFLVEGIHLSRYGYIYKTDAFERYVDSLLRKIIGQDNTVTFKDLKIPLTIVTSDISSHNYKVLSTWENPDMSVAHAVVASAAIPGYFAPVDGIYVDGCIVSNLPVFSVVKDSIYDRVLTFTTDSHSLRAAGDLDTLEVVKQVAETIAQGGVDIQLASLPACYNIRIPTEDFDILEFSILFNKKKRQYVMQLGANAMRNFLKDKRNYHNNQFDTNIFAAETDPRMQVSYLSRGPLQTIHVISHDTKWMDTQFPLIVKWHNQGCKVYVYTLPCAADDYKEEKRRTTLLQLGFQINECAKLPVQGYFFSYANQQYSCLIAQPEDNFADARIYSHSSDQFLILSSIERLQSIESKIIAPEESAKQPLILEPDSPQRHIEELTCTGGKYEGCTGQVQTVPIAQLYFTDRYVSGYKFQNLHHLYALYQEAHIAPFSSARLRNGENTYSLKPVIAIEKDGKLTVVDGATRAIYAFRKSIASIELIVLKGDNISMEAGNCHTSELILTSKGQG